MKRATPPQFVLASTSPRRIEMIQSLGIKPYLVSPEIDESIVSGESAKIMVKRLSLEKAHASVLKISENALLHKKLMSPRFLLLSADTTVLAPNGEILAKPCDSPNPKKEAARMLALLSGQTHQVLTGYCIMEVSNARLNIHQQVVSSKVTFMELGSKRIEHYIRSGEPLDKAGAYAAQGLGMSLIRQVKGSYSNIVGLPLVQILEDLHKHFGWQPLG